VSDIIQGGGKLALLVNVIVPGGNPTQNFCGY